jgi:hypothetical protein
MLKWAKHWPTPSLSKFFLTDELKEAIDFAKDKITGTIMEKEYRPYWNEDKAPAYFKPTPTTYAIMPYSYLKNNGLENELLDQLVAHLPQGAYIAGGFMSAVMAGVKNYKGDVDFFFNSSRAFEKLLNLLQDPGSATVYQNYKASIPVTNESFNLSHLDAMSQKFRLVNFEPTDLTDPQRLKYQLVKLFWFDSAIHVIDSFDFTICQFATDGEYIYYNPRSLIDLNNKEIIFHQKKQPALHGMRRILKYVGKGFNIKQSEYQDIAEAAADFILKHWEDMENASKDEAQTNGEVFYMDWGENSMSYNFVADIWKYIEDTKCAPEIFSRTFANNKIDFDKIG